MTVAVGACGSSSRSASPAGSNAGATTTIGHTPTLTIPGLVAPPRSYKPVFTGVAAKVEDAFRARLAAFENKDVAAAIALERTKVTTRAQLLSFMNTYRIRLYRITAITVHGKTAKVDYENAIVGRNLKSDRTTTLLGQHDVWTNVGGAWKWDSDTASSPGIPRGLTSVTVTLRDHAATVVPSRLPGDDFAFLLKNTGVSAKGVFILGIPADAKVTALLPVVAAIGNERNTNTGASELPDGILEMGATPDVPAHKDGTMVFSGRLPHGRYLLVSRSANGGSLLPNEYADFTVG
jgi:hypothetical protein